MAGCFCPRSICLASFDDVAAGSLTHAVTVDADGEYTADSGSSGD